MAAVAAGEAEQLLVDAAANGDDLEQLAHFLRQQQPVGGAGSAHIVGRVGRLAAKQVEDAAVEQELALARVAEQVETAGVGGRDDGGEIDVRRDILQAGQMERVGVRVMPVVAHQRAATALRMVELVAREAIVDQQQRAALQAVTPLRGPGARGEADLAFVARR